MNAELKPCPFCGGKAEEDCTGALEIGGECHQTGWINCTSCGAQGPSVDMVDGKPDYQLVRDGWNKRAEYVNSRP